MTVENVLITGASSGIGVELARLFAADGSNLVLTARRVDPMNALADELRRKHGVEVQVLQADLARPEAPDELAAALTEQGLQIDVLVNNAGFGGRGRFVELNMDNQARMVQVNIAAVTRLARLFLPGMIQRRFGGVLNVGSMAGFVPGPHMAVYYATKAYILSFTEALAEEVKGCGVTVSCLAPGPTATGFGEAAETLTTPMFRYNVASAESVARIGYAGFRRGKLIVVPGLINRVMIGIPRLLPRAWVRKAVSRLNR